MVAPAERNFGAEQHRALANPSAKEEEEKNDDDGDGGRETWGQHLSCIGRPPSSQPHFSGFFPHQSDTRLHHPSLTLSLGLYGKCIYTRWKSARIVGTDNYAEMLIEIMHLASSDIMQINVFTFRLCLDP